MNTSLNSSTPLTPGQGVPVGVPVSQPVSAVPLQPKRKRNIPLSYVIGALALLLLCIGGAVAFYLSTRTQEIRQQASGTPTYCTGGLEWCSTTSKCLPAQNCPKPECTFESSRCNNNIPQWCNGDGKWIDVLDKTPDGNWMSTACNGQGGMTQCPTGSTFAASVGANITCKCKAVNGPDAGMESVFYASDGIPAICTTSTGGTGTGHTPTCPGGTTTCTCSNSTKCADTGMSCSDLCNTKGGGPKAATCPGGTTTCTCDGGTKCADAGMSCSNVCSTTTANSGLGGCSTGGQTRCVNNIEQKCDGSQWQLTTQACGTTSTVSLGNCTEAENGKTRCVSNYRQVCYSNEWRATGLVCSTNSSLGGCPKDGDSRCISGLQQVCAGSSWQPTNVKCGTGTGGDAFSSGDLTGVVCKRDNPAVCPGVSYAKEAYNLAIGGKCTTGTDGKLKCENCTAYDKCSPYTNAGGSCAGVRRLSGGEQSHGGFVGCSGAQNCFCGAAYNQTQTNDFYTAADGNIRCYDDVGNDSCGSNQPKSTPLAATPGVTPSSTPGSTPGVTPTPVVGPVCLNISTSMSNPQIGNTITFTCGQVTGANHYEFRIQLPNGTVNSLAATGNVSAAFTVAQTGQHKAQCRICTTADANSCQAYESL